MFSRPALGLHWQWTVCTSYWQKHFPLLDLILEAMVLSIE